MIDPKKIEQIARQVHESMPKGLRDLGEDVEKKIRQALQSQLTRLDLVSREEFDVQTQVLLRTREKLALLEQRLNDLENCPAATVTTPTGRASTGGACSLRQEASAAASSGTATTRPSMVIRVRFVAIVLITASLPRWPAASCRCVHSRCR